MKKMNKKGFTLVELLAVIVILALIMAIAVVSMGGIMQSAREGTFKDTALSIINGVKQQLAVNGQIASTTAGSSYYFFQEKMLEKGGDKSPLGGQIQYISDPDTSGTNAGKSAVVGSSYRSVSKIGSNGIYKYTDSASLTCGKTTKSFVTVSYNTTTKVFEYGICLTAGAGNPHIDATEKVLLDTENNTSAIVY